MPTSCENENPMKEIEELVSLDLKTSEGHFIAIMALIDRIHHGRAEMVLHVLEERLMHCSPSIQLRALNLLDELLANSGAILAVPLGSERSVEHLFSVCRLAESESVRDRVMYYATQWDKRYRAHSSGFGELLKRFDDSKILRASYTKMRTKMHINATNLVVGVEHVQHNQQSMLSSRDGGAGSFRHTTSESQSVYVDTEESVYTNSATSECHEGEAQWLAKCQEDLVLLRSAVEHAEGLKHHEHRRLAKECQRNKLTCLSMLESGQHERVATALMSLMEATTNVLRQYVAVARTEVGSGSLVDEEDGESGGITRSNSGSGATTTTTKQIEQSAKRCATKGGAQMDSPKKPPLPPPLQQQQQQRQQQQAQQQQQQKLPQLVVPKKVEGALTQEDMARQLEEMQRRYEKLQMKYNNAKKKNEDAVSEILRYAERVDELERREGASRMSSSSPTSCSEDDQPPRRRTLSNLTSASLHSSQPSSCLTKDSDGRPVKVPRRRQVTFAAEMS